MKVFKLEKIGLRRKDPFKIEDGFSKKNMDGCPSIIEVNGVYYGIEQPYFRYSQMEARGSHLPSQSPDTWNNYYSIFRIRGIL